MASYTEKRIIQGTLLTAQAVSMYVCVAPATKAIVKEIAICNTTDTPYTFSLYVVVSGQVVANQYAIFKAVAMQPNETKIFGLTTVLEVGDSIWALASTANVLSISASGVERS